MKAPISVFGLGYVGCVSAACFANEGHQVIGVDVSPSKVDQINSGKSTIVEDGITELVAKVAKSGHLSATTDLQRAIQQTQISLVCVGTPSRSNGSLDLSFVLRVSSQIGEALRAKGRGHTVVIRSTVMPGSIEGHVIPAIERASGLKHGEDFVVCSNPEFLREGTSIRDFSEPPFTLIGAMDHAQATPVAELYSHVVAPRHVVPIRVAEMIKYTCNSFHALKVGFANEIGALCKSMGIDSHEVMKLFCEDTRLNISKAYLRPAFAFGGSCLPKDLRALIHRGRLEDTPLPILEAVIDSNRRQVERAFHLITEAGSRRVGMLGLTFKAGTDDLRESPLVTLAEMLLGKGYQLTIHDSLVAKANIIGANRDYVEREIPHLWSLMRPSPLEVLESSDTIVIGANVAEYRDLGGALSTRNVVDLVRAVPGRLSGEGYHGTGW